MPVLETRVDPRSDEFRAHREQMGALVAECGLRVPEDVEVVFRAVAVVDPGKSEFPHARPS
ncbi:MAG: hypothetical protein N2688_13545, partial [Burkholderiaceae bacterium]|nr:hypothetical protein [Burkholderiaceae bacterium]